MWGIRSILPIFLVLVYISIVQCQVPSVGRCSDLPVVKNFNVQRYLGKWYEIEKYFTIFELGGTCITATYSDLGNGTVGVYNAQTQALTRRRAGINGTARLLDPEGSAKLGVRFRSVPFAGEAPYWVLSTDYDNYAIVWSCNQVTVLNFQIVWYLSRERFPSEEQRKMVYHTLESLGLSTSQLQKTEQTKCPETY